MRERSPASDRRAVDGVLLLDKPGGVGSNAVLQHVKRAYRACKAGHTGSLDPLATGVLPICLGRATRAARFLLDADKRYRATARLGVRTDTGDADGQPTAFSTPSRGSCEQLAATRERFLGAQTQTPPMYSALKRGGTPLYALARRGLEVERAPRSVEIHALELLGCDGTTFSFQVWCSKGTYVRVLAEDWAQSIGQCAHVTALRRISAGPFDESQTVSMRQIDGASSLQELDALLVPITRLFAGWPRVRVDKDAALRLSQGQRVHVTDADKVGSVAIVDASGRVLGVGEVDAAGRVLPKRWLAQVSDE
ncbi:MAG TPA: tRNA pseudouridine(55) synthase TruB [Nevskiaceae bacterium]